MGSKFGYRLDQSLMDFRGYNSSKLAQYPFPIDENVARNPTPTILHRVPLDQTCKMGYPTSIENNFF